MIVMPWQQVVGTLCRQRRRSGCCPPERRAGGTVLALLAPITMVVERPVGGAPASRFSVAQVHLARGVKFEAGQVLAGDVRPPGSKWRRLGCRFGLCQPASVP